MLICVACGNDTTDDMMVPTEVGVINVAIVGNQIILPTLYGKCDLLEISRYKGVIKFINQVLLSKRAIVP